MEGMDFFFSFFFFTLFSLLLFFELSFFSFELPCLSFFLGNIEGYLNNYMTHLICEGIYFVERVREGHIT